MPAVWFALKRSMKCRSQHTEVHEPESGNKKLSNISTKKSSGGRSGCSRSIANLKDVVINGSKRHTEKAPMCSPRSIGSSELLNPITHQVVLDNSTCELKISGGSDFVGVLKPGTPGPGGFHVGPVRRSSSSLSRRSSGSTMPISSFGGVSHGALFCPKCGHQFLRWEAVEAHFLSSHAGHSIHSFISCNFHIFMFGIVILILLITKTNLGISVVSLPFFLDLCSSY